MTSEKREIASLPEMKRLARELAETIKNGARRRLLLLLDGPMGAGKTQFTRFLVEELGSSETASPSFAIHHSYLGENKLPIEHFDLFRLEDLDDLESTGFWDFFRSREAIVIVEWAERLTEFGLVDQLPLTGVWPRMRLKFELGEGERRQVEISRE